VRSEAERQRIVGLAHRYYQSFDNVFGGPGILDRGIIRPLPRTQSEDELGRNLLVCTRDEMIDRLGEYDRLGIDEVIVTSVYGQDEAETLDMMQGLAEEVFPAFRSNMS
jgi:flavin-dependent trigonelline monooxygenase, oxygenase component